MRLEAFVCLHTRVSWTQLLSYNLFVLTVNPNPLPPKKKTARAETPAVYGLSRGEELTRL